MYCQNCGAELNDVAKFCPHCGQQVQDQTMSHASDGNATASASSSSVNEREYGTFLIGAVPVTKEQCTEIDTLLEKGNKDEAINLVKQLTNLSAAEARSFIGSHQIGVWRKKAQSAHPENPVSSVTSHHAESTSANQSQVKKTHLKTILLWLCILLAINGIGRHRLKNELIGSWTNGEHFGDVVFSDSYKFQYDSVWPDRTATWIPLGWRTLMICEPKTIPSFIWINIDKSSQYKTVLTFTPEYGSTHTLIRYF